MLDWKSVSVQPPDRSVLLTDGKEVIEVRWKGGMWGDPMYEEWDADQRLEGPVENWVWAEMPPPPKHEEKKV